MSLIPVINGSPLPVINESQLRFKPFDGGETGGTYEGLDKYIQPLIPLLYNSGYSVTYRKSKSPISTVEFSAAFSASGGGPATNPNLDYKDTWELVRNVVQKQLLESDHPLVNQVTNIGDDLNVGNMDRLKLLLANPDLWDTAAPDTFVNDGDGAASQAASVYLFNLFKSGVTTTEVKQPILRLTRTTNPLYDAPFDVSNIDTLMTGETMISDSGVPSNFAVPLISLANQLAAKAFYPHSVANPPIQVRSDGLTLEFAWLKNLVSCTKHGSERIQYILEYQFGLWDAMLYGVAS